MLFYEFLDNRHFDLVLSSISANNLYYLYQSFSLYGALNHGGFYCPSIDELFQSAFIEFDPCLKQSLFSQIQEILAHKLPILSLTTHSSFIGFNFSFHQHSFSLSSCYNILILTYIKKEGVVG